MKTNRDVKRLSPNEKRAVDDGNFARRLEDDLDDFLLYADVFSGSEPTISSEARRRSTARKRLPRRLLIAASLLILAALAAFGMVQNRVIRLARIDRSAQSARIDRSARPVRPPRLNRSVDAAAAPESRTENGQCGTPSDLLPAGVVLDSLSSPDFFRTMIRITAEFPLAFLLDPETLLGAEENPNRAGRRNSILPILPAEEEILTEGKAVLGYFAASITLPPPFREGENRDLESPSE